MTDSITVANKILDIAKEKGHAVTPLQLIKLVYLCHGWALAYFKRPLINEDIEAWQYGPVIPKLYRKVKPYKNQPVKGPLLSAASIFGNQSEALNEDEVELINAVYHSYGQYSGIDLSNLTHRSDSPWDVTWNEFGKNAIISNDLIQQHYDQILRERTKKTANAT